MSRTSFDRLATSRQLGKYIVQRRLGSGAGSVIFEVLDPQTNQTYALKRILKRSFSDERFCRQAENEYQVGRRIDHPVIRKMYQLTRIRSFFRVREMHLLMEMVEGQTVESHRPKNLLTTVRIFQQAVEGLGAMHAAGFAHADVKPNNIMVGPSGQVKIIDLGQGCPLGTVKERIQGTPDFIAPEQVHRRPIDQRTDVFNVGATLYWVLTGRPIQTVLPKTQPGRDIALVTSTTTPPPDQLRANVPPALSRLAMDCINPSPADRPASMKVLANRLEMIAVIISREVAASPPVANEADDAEVPPADDDTVDLASSGRS